MSLWKIIQGEQPGLITSILNYENRGQFGEFATEFALTNHNLEGELVVLKNVYVPYRGKTAEIDLLMIHETGIFVFESKNYSGWIFGSMDQLYWTQSLQSGEKHRFYNPIKQNETHRKALAEYLNVPLSALKSYIVFSERCSLKNVPGDTEEVVVVRRPNMLKKLRGDIHHAGKRYSYLDIQRFVQRLEPLTNVANEEKKRHIEDIQEKCPFCGKELVLRKGRYGSFLGCSAYPKCNFTRQVKK